MSFPRSRRVPTFAEHKAAVRAALVDVAEETYFAFTSPGDETMWDEFPGAEGTGVAVNGSGRATPVNGSGTPVAVNGSGRPAPAGQWLSAEVRFKGAFCGLLEIVMPEALARSLATALLGMDPDEELSADQVHDSTGEFTNIVCGTWLTRVARTRHFDLGGPKVTRVAGGGRHAAAVSANGAPLSADGAPRSADGAPVYAPPADGCAANAIEMRVNDLPLRLRVEFHPFEA